MRHITFKNFIQIPLNWILSELTYSLNFTSGLTPKIKIISKQIHGIHSIKGGEGAI